MKNIFKTAALSLALILTYSCEEGDDVIETGNVSGQTLVSFANSAINFPVNIDTGNYEAEIDVTINISTLSASDRTFNVVVLESSTADPENYQVPSTIVVPANTYNASFTVNGQDTTLETVSETLVLELTSPTASDVTTGSVTLSLFQVCPIADDYLIGTYEISDNTKVFNGANWDTAQVEITSSGATNRSFPTTFFGRPVTVTLDLVCNELRYATNHATGYSCGGPITLAPSANNTSVYDLSDDSFFVVDYDIAADCLAPANPRTRSFFLIKL
jgi:hypothetical protein